MPGGTRIRIGVLAAEDHRDWAQGLADALPARLRDRVDGDVEWRVEVCETGPADVADGARELTDAVRRRLLDRGWDLGIGLTVLPIADGRRLAATYVSGSHGVGIVSIPALGALQLSQRLRDVSADLVAALIGSSGDGGAYDARGTVRLLAGMIRANRPMRVILGLSRSATAALGTGAYALSSSSIWILATESSWARLAAVAAVSILLILVSILLAHGLWERSDNPAARERVVLFNVVTLVTLAIGMATLYVGLFLVIALAAAVAIPPGAFESQTDVAATAGEYARLAWFAASVATVGGALGSLVERSDAIREAVYHPRLRESG